MSKFGAKWCLTFLVAQIIEIKFTQSGKGTESKPLLYTVHNYEFKHIFVILYLCYLCKSMNLGPSMDGPEQLPKWDLPFQRSQHPKLCSWIGPLADEQIPFIDIHSGRRHWEVSWIFDCNICFLRSLYWRNLELLQVAGNPRESTGIRKLNHGILPKGRLNRGHQWQKALQLFGNWIGHIAVHLRQGVVEYREVMGGIIGMVWGVTEFIWVWFSSPSELDIIDIMHCKICRKQAAGNHFGSRRLGI